MQTRRHYFKTSAMKTASTPRPSGVQQLIRTILVPVDFSDCSLPGLKYAIRLAREVGARVTVLHVTDLGPVMMTTGDGHYDSPAYLEAARRRCGGRMQAFLKQVDFDCVKVDTFSVAGYCPAAIYEAAEKQCADLIVISTHGRTGLRRAFLGSIAEKTARHARCPVLVVPSFQRMPKDAVSQLELQTSFKFLPQPKWGGTRNAWHFAIPEKRESFLVVTLEA
jgi:nucleotide-binding universal stress UspA family protein